MAPAPAAPANRGLIIGLVAGVVVVVAALVVGIVLVTHKTTTTATTASSGLPPSTSLSEFESDVKTQLGEAEPKGFAVAGVGSVVCNMPRVWQPGATFQCFAYSSTSPEGLGVVDVTVETTQPGDVYDDNLSWRPAAAAGNTGSGNSGSGSSGTGTSGSGNSGNSGSGNSGSSRTQ